jgi:hypothetical protein
MTDEAYKALDMLNAFASVGVHRFDVTFTDLDGKKLENGGFLGNRDVNELRRMIGRILREAEAHQHNVIIRPRKPERAELIQLDDLNPEQLRRLEHRAFMTLCTSPGNHQAWVAVSNPEPDFARRLRKGTGADPTASGATRISGSRNFKRKHGPHFPLVEVAGSNPGLTQTRAELENAGLVAAPEPPPAILPRRVSPTSTSRKKWPSYERCVNYAPHVHQGNRPDISKADFVWCMTALDWGWSIEDTAGRLFEVSSKAQENGEAYALLTAQNAAAAVERRRGNAR